MKDLHVRLHSAIDRFNEAHWFLHQVEANYHQADPLRWSINAFLRALKEVPQLITVAFQNDAVAKAWYRGKRKVLHKNPLLSVLFKKRDLIVHRGMLVPESDAAVGLTEGRGMKFGFTFALEPYVDSDEAMLRYLGTAQAGDVLGLLEEDEESLPCVHRTWRMTDFPEHEIVELFAKAWVAVGEVLSSANEHAGHQALKLALDCRHAAQDVQFKLYDREALRRLMSSLSTTDGSAV